MEEKISYKIESKDNNKRLDLVLSEHIKHYSRNYIQKLINQNLIKVNNNNKIKASYKVLEGDNIEILIPKEKLVDIKPENIPINIIYEDKDILIVNKRQGMVVHPATGNLTGTLVNALLYHCKTLSDINGEFRPGIVHRINKDTSGLIVIAKNNDSHINLADQFKGHFVKRKYIALTEGVIKVDKGTINYPIGRHQINRKRMDVNSNRGKVAITQFSVLKRYASNTLIEALLYTGRTHQIRVHMKKIGHPIVGDTIYGYKKQKFNLEGQLLHAQELGFIHPTTGDYVNFTSELPNYFTKIINLLQCH